MDLFGEKANKISEALQKIKELIEKNIKKEIIKSIPQKLVIQKVQICDIPPIIKINKDPVNIPKNPFPIIETNNPVLHLKNIHNKKIFVCGDISSNWLNFEKTIKYVFGQGSVNDNNYQLKISENFKNRILIFLGDILMDLFAENNEKHNDVQKILNFISVNYDQIAHQDLISSSYISVLDGRDDTRRFLKKLDQKGAISFKNIFFIQGNKELEIFDNILDIKQINRFDNIIVTDFHQLYGKLLKLIASTSKTVILLYHPNQKKPILLTHYPKHEKQVYTRLTYGLVNEFEFEYEIYGHDNNPQKNGKIFGIDYHNKNPFKILTFDATDYNFENFQLINI